MPDAAEEDMSDGELEEEGGGGGNDLEDDSIHSFEGHSSEWLGWPGVGLDSSHSANAGCSAERPSTLLSMPF